MQSDTATDPLVYLVDDDRDCRDEMVSGLARLGLDAHGFPDAPALYRAHSVRPPDVVVIDIDLKGEDGLSVVSHLRASGAVGIVMATARDSIEDRIDGLRSGADAYLVKPVDIRELGATVIAVDQRARPHRPVLPAPTQQWALVEGGWALSDGLGHRLPLTASERHLLGLLLRERGRSVARDAMVEALGGDVHDFDHNRLHTIVSRLRHRARKAGMRLPLHAVRGVGFSFADDATDMESGSRATRR